MRIKPDENLPTSLVEALVQLGHDADCSPPSPPWPPSSSPISLSRTVTLACSAPRPILG
ncbi:hypothetical protein [Sorangium sp. So ce341]|uniref:hypothetical protein n=1 Tax=Sorangium sp. So ce341 TaxID=3133302 RepID=UPI003F600812